MCMAFGCYGNTFALKLLVIFSQSQSGWTQIWAPFIYRYWNTNLRSMFSMLDQGSFCQQKMPYKNDASLLKSFVSIFGPNVQHTNHKSSPSSIHNPSQQESIRPEAQIGPLLSGYLLRSSLVNWAKALATNSSKSLGHVPARRVRRSGLPFWRGFHTKVTMESQHALLANRM